jgi:PII-like signaling protein
MGAPSVFSRQPDDALAWRPLPPEPPLSAADGFRPSTEAAVPISLSESFRRAQPTDRSAVVNPEGIVLTSYISGGRPIDSRLTADRLIELYRMQAMAASILLRGIQGFGPDQDLHAGRFLHLHKDRPLTVLAVDVQSKIEAVLERTLELNRSGITAVAPAQFLSGEILPVGIAEDADEATKLTVYFGSQDQVYAVPAFEAICELLRRRDIPGATAMPGVDGSARGRRQRAQFFSRDAVAPLMVIAVGSGGQIGTILPELGDLLRHPLMTLERVRLCKHNGQLINRPEQVSGVDDHGFALYQRLAIYISAAARRDGQPIHRAIVRRLHSVGIRGVTTQRGIWGFHGDRIPHGDQFLHLSHHVPAVTTVIDTPGHISAAFDVVDELTSEHGLVTSETIPVKSAVGTFTASA